MEMIIMSTAFMCGAIGLWCAINGIINYKVNK